MGNAIEVTGLRTHYGQREILKGISISVPRGKTSVILGGSGCGKSTLLKHLIGLIRPTEGKIAINGRDIAAMNEEELNGVRRKMGVLFQGAALLNSLTVAENVALPLQQYTDLSPGQIKKIVLLKLALVGLAGFEEYYPSEISGGMKKRAGLARAMALDPDILFFDEPSAGLDPISAHLLDELIIELRNSLGATVVVVTHELASIFAIGNNSVFLDAETRTMIATGSPRRLLDECRNRTVRRFLTRGTEGDDGPGGGEPCFLA